jgi:hypothetical protein
MLYRILILIAALFSFNMVNAQFQLPRIDLEVKVSENISPGGGDNQQYSLRALETTNLHLATHIQINQHIAVGWFYSTSIRGNGYNAPHDFKFNFGSGDTKALSFFTGPDIRISAGRATRWRPYLSINYCKAQIIEDKGTYRLATNVNAFGGSFGIMRRMSNRLYWNVIEIGGRKLSQKIYWQENGFLLDLKMGFTYNIGKKK